MCFVWLPEQAAIISPAKAAFDSKLDLYLTKIQVNYYMRSTAVCGAGTGALREVGQRQLEGLEIYCSKRGETSWTDLVRNKLLQKVKDGRNTLRTEGPGTRGRRRKHIPDKLQEERR
jgi:hypothetical protein